MNVESDIIGIRSTDTAFDSLYIPFISFANQEQKKAVEDYIISQAANFFKKIETRHPAVISRTQLPYSKLITDKDFKDCKTIKIKYFYKNFFHDLERDSDGKLKLRIKWSITFDEKCTPIKLVSLRKDYRGYDPKPNDFSDKDVQGRPHRKYGTIEINGEPVFYYIYFTIQEILDVVKEIPHLN
ncbi:MULTISPECIES: hypothetical protein [unclassified Anabaena]|uniref:hypothetical protein n=1 Tax=unclassified Anabaena TaxID=2619674 RepID=UPI001444AF1A|nr:MULTISPECIES: hypothetical protein [unclassified Anabaena]MTJ08598.1 hypothetical protein [Anabaena sp. UHCC 0204]MTJ53841.1 hypothetical protein [Anabaena sp. UHCC 0253]